MFTQRLSKDGIDGNKWWYDHSYNPFAQNDLWLPNCTCYAFGRSSELANKNLRNDLMDSYPNAQNWWTVTKWQKGSTPKLGAIGVWGGNQYGHVAVVEDIKGDTVTFSQSNYERPINKNSPNYFQVRDYRPMVGKVTSGVGIKFLGYIYNPYVTDARVARDETKNQVEVKADLIRIRKSPNGEILKGRYCVKGLYNILATDQGEYLWCKLADETWIATTEEWATVYLAASQDTEALQSEIKRLERLLAEEEQKHTEDVKTLTDSVSALNTRLEAIKGLADEILKLCEV